MCGQSNEVGQITVAAVGGLITVANLGCRWTVDLSNAFVAQLVEHPTLNR